MLKIGDRYVKEYEKALLKIIVFDDIDIICNSLSDMQGNDEGIGDDDDIFGGWV